MTILKRSLFTLVWFADWSISVNADPLSKNSTMSVEGRAVLGEKLIFGLKGASRTEFRVGRAQCTVCHDFFQELKPAAEFPRPSPPYGPHFYDHFTERVQRLVANPEYRQRPKDTEQPEAFPWEWDRHQHHRIPGGVESLPIVLCGPRLRCEKQP